MNRYNHYNPELDAFELYHIEAEDVKPLKVEKARIQPPDEYNAVIAGLSGAIGTSISNIAVYPIDLIVKRLQVQRALRETTSNGESNSKTNDDDELYKDFVDAAKKIYRDEGGVGAFYSGCLHDTANSMGSAFIYFLAYHLMRQRRLQAQISPSGRIPKTLGVFEEISIGVLSGAIAKFFTAPIANIVTRKQTAGLRSKSEKKDNDTKDSSSDMSSIVQDIYAEKGVQGFWSGYDATLILTLNPAITFFLYETFKAMLPRKFREKPTGGQTFVLAAVSKAIASSVMYPVSMAKARSQVQRKKKSGGGLAIFDSLKDTYMSGGIAAMYEGVWGEVMKGFFSNGITMLIKEALHRQILGLYFLLVRLRQKNKSITQLATEATHEKLESIKNQVTSNSTAALKSSQEVLSTAKEQVTSGSTAALKSSQEALSTVKEQVTSNSNAALKNSQEALSTAKEQVTSTLQSGAAKAASATTEARKNLANIIDPETPHVGDVSSEVGGIEWQDAEPFTAQKKTVDSSGKIGGIEWNDREKK